MYEEFAKTAKKEGYDNVAELFLGVASVEKFHESRYEQLKKEIDEKTVFSAPKEVY
jgi:rubrerythrin